MNFDLRTAAALRGTGPTGSLAAIFIVALVLLARAIAAAAVFLWLWLSRTELKHVGLVAPKSWLDALVLGVLSGVGAKLLLKAVVMPWVGAPPTNPMLAPLAGNLPLAVEEMAEVIVFAGMAEEIVFRGFLFHQIGRAHV